MRRLLTWWLVVLLAGFATVACTGEDAEDDGVTLDDRLLSAKRQLDQAASIRLSLSTERLPDGVAGITEARGVATHAPAFEGTITIAASGLFDGQAVEVVAVDGEVFAQTPFASTFIRVDPADFNAPDPATLMDTERGLSTLLREARNLSEAGQEREGEQVLTSIDATVPGSAVARIFPSASARQPFDATFAIDEEDRLRRARITGPFYGDAPPVTYDITVDASDEQVEITAP